MDGLFIDGRGGDAGGFEDTVDGFLRNGLRGEGAAGVAAIENRGEIHGAGFSVILYKPPTTTFSARNGKTRSMNVCQ